MSKPRTRANGEGSIYEVVINGHKVWRATTTVEMEMRETCRPSADDPSRIEVVPRREARKISGTAATKTEAIRRRERNLTKYKVAIGALPTTALDTTPKQERLETAELLARWLLWKTTTVEHGHLIGANVARMYERTIDLHINPHVGRTPVRLLTRADLAELLTTTLPNKTKADGSPLLGSSPLRQVRNILAMSMTWAVDQELIVRNPAERLPTFAKAVKVDEGLEKLRYIPRQLIARHLGSDQEATWILAYYGFRQSERLGLTWDCFENLDGATRGKPITVEIKQQLWRHPQTGALSIKPDTKTEAGRRILSLPAPVIAIMRRHKARQDEQRTRPEWKPLPGMDNLVYTEPNGRPCRHQTDNKRWKSMLERENLTFIRGHALRHIAISMLVGDGVAIELVRAIAGHADAEITRAVYTHLGYRPTVAPMDTLTTNLFQKVKPEKLAEFTPSGRTRRARVSKVA